MNEELIKTMKRYEIKLDRIESMLREIIEDHELRIKSLENKTNILVALRD